MGGSDGGRWGGGDVASGGGGSWRVGGAGRGGGDFGRTEIRRCSALRVVASLFRVQGVGVRG